MPSALHRHRSSPFGAASPLRFICYNVDRGFTLQNQLLLAPLKVGDDSATVDRNRIGDLLRLPKPFSASYGDDTYESKLPHYFGQNLLAASLSPLSYTKKPGFVSYTAGDPAPDLAGRQGVGGCPRREGREQLVQAIARFGCQRTTTSDVLERLPGVRLAMGVHRTHVHDRP